MLPKRRIFGHPKIGYNQKKMKDASEKRVNYIIEAWENLKKKGAYHVKNEEGFLKNSKAILSYHKNDFKIQIISSNHPTKEEIDDPFNLLNGRLRLRRNERSIIVDVEDIKSLTQSFSGKRCLAAR